MAKPADNQPDQHPHHQAEADGFEAFRSACQKALFQRKDVTLARVKVAMVLLEHGNRKLFRKGHGFLTWPSRATLLDEARVTHGALNRSLLWLQNIGFWTDAEKGRRPDHLRRRKIAADFPTKRTTHVVP